MTTFTFKHLWVLLNLLWIPVWYWYAVRTWHAKRFVAHASTQALAPLSTNPVKIPLLARALSLGCIVLALARPQMVTSYTDSEKNGIDILLALDLSTSMMAPDFISSLGKRTTRIQAAKNVIEEFIHQRTNDRIGLIAFARYPYLVSPLTLKHHWLLDNLKRLKTGLIEDGTAIGSAISMGINRMKDQANKSRIIILLTDGVNNCGTISPTMAAKLAKSFNIKIYTILVGNDQVMPADESVLSAIAQTTQGKFYRAYDFKTLRMIYHEIDTLETSKHAAEDYQTQNDYFQYFLLLAALGLITEASLRLYRYRVVS